MSPRVALLFHDPFWLHIWLHIFLTFDVFACLPKSAYDHNKKGFLYFKTAW
jgi:hypothetical protein